MASLDVILGKITNYQEPSTCYANLKDQSRWIQVQSKGSIKGPLVDSRMTGKGMGLVGNLMGNASTVTTLGIWCKTAGTVLESDRSNIREEVGLWAHKDIMVRSMSMGQSCHRYLHQGNCKGLSE